MVRVPGFGSVELELNYICQCDCEQVDRKVCIVNRFSIFFTEQGIRTSDIETRCVIRERNDR